MNYKFVIVGNIGVGKSALVKRLAHDVFSPGYKSTIGIDRVDLKTTVNDLTVNVTLIDIAGQELYGNMTHLYYKDSEGAFVMVDATNETTLENSKRWKKDLDAKMGQKPCILLINKSDLLTDDEKSFDYDTFCEKYGFHKWIGISVKDSVGTSNVLDYMIEACQDKHEPKKFTLNNNEPKLLRDELNEITQNVVKNRESYVQKQYNNLQSYVVDKLRMYAYEGIKCEIGIGNLYVENYYEEPVKEGDKLKLAYTKLGTIFSEGCDTESTYPKYPNLSELEYLSTRLREFLESQKLKVLYTSHCCMEISWQ